MFKCIVNPTTEDVVHPVNASIRGGFIASVSAMVLLALHKDHPWLATAACMSIAYGLHYYSAKKALQNFQRQSGAAN